MQAVVIEYSRPRGVPALRPSLPHGDTISTVNLFPLVMPESSNMKTRRTLKLRRPMAQVHAASKSPSVHVEHVVLGASQVWTMSPL